MNYLSKSILLITLIGLTVLFIIYPDLFYRNLDIWIGYPLLVWLIRIISIWASSLPQSAWPRSSYMVPIVVQQCPQCCEAHNHHAV